MVELARVRTAQPRLQLLAVEAVAVEVAVHDNVGGIGSGVMEEGGG